MRLPFLAAIDTRRLSLRLRLLRLTPRKELNMGEHTIIYQPQIIRETAEGLNRLDIRDEMLSRRELELMTSVDAETAQAARSKAALRSMTSCRP